MDESDDAPTTRAKFLFLHLAEPTKVNFQQERPESEIDRMFKRPIGKEDMTLSEVGEKSDEDEMRPNSISVQSKRPVSKDLNRADLIRPPSVISSSKKTRRPTSKASRGSQESNRSSRSRRSFRNKRPDSSSTTSTHTSREDMYGPPRDREPEALSMALFKQDVPEKNVVQRQERVRVRDKPEQPDLSDDEEGAVPAFGLSKQIESAAAVMQNRRVLETRGKVERESTNRKARRETKMQELVTSKRLPWKVLLDHDVAQEVEHDLFKINSELEDDPDAYDTDELLSDVESISSTDDEDTSRQIARRRKLRAKRQKRKIKAIRKRKRLNRQRRKKDLDRAQHQYYDELIEELCMENHALRPPDKDADLDSKRVFVDRGNAQTATRDKVEQMRSWIVFGATLFEGLSTLVGFPKLHGFSSEIQARLQDQSCSPMLAQLARKWLRKGPSSPEWALLLVFVTAMGAKHLENTTSAASESGSSSVSGLGTLLGLARNMFGKGLSSTTTSVGKGFSTSGTGSNPKPTPRAPHPPTSPPKPPAREQPSPNQAPWDTWNVTDDNTNTGDEASGVLSM